MAISEEASSLVSELNEHINEEEPDYASIERISLGLLKLDERDPEFWKCLCVSMLFQNKEKDLQKHMKSSIFRQLVKEHEELRFFKAYTSYRQEKLGDVKQILGDLRSSDAQHLRAQVLYTEKKYKDALDIYETLGASEDPHLATNVCACALRAGLYNEAIRCRLQRSMFHYQNVALGHLRLGQFERGKLLLQQAIELGQSEGEREEDIVELKNMSAYCMEQLNEQAQALEIYQEIENSDAKNPIVQLRNLINKSASVDLESLNSYEKFCILDNLKTLRKCDIDDEDKKIVETNYIVLLTKCSQANAARSLIGSCEVLDDEAKIILRASLQAKSNVKMALETVRKGIETLTNTGKQADELKLIEASLLIRNARPGEAISILQSTVTLRRYPALVGVITTLLSNENKVDEAVEEFDVAIRFWEPKKDKKSEEIVLELQMGKANVLLHHNRNDEVTLLFNKMLQKESKYTTKIRAHLIQSTSYSDMDSASRMCDEIPTPENLPDALDLINNGCIRITQKRKLKMDKNFETIRNNQERTKRKKSENREKGDPNPKRWQPKRKKRKKKNQFHGSQGVATAI